MTIEKLSQLERYSNCPDHGTLVNVNFPRLYHDIRKELATAELRGEQHAERRMLDAAAAAQTVARHDGVKPFAERLANVEHAVKRWEHGDGSKAIQGLDDRITGIAEHVDSMRGVFKLEGKENALALLKRIEAAEKSADAAMRNYQSAMLRIEDLERNLGPDLKNEVAQAQIAKYQGLGKRVAALEAAAVPPGPPEHRDLVALDKHFDGRVDALSKRVDALSKRLAALEAWLGR